MFNPGEQNSSYFVLALPVGRAKQNIGIYMVYQPLLFLFYTILACWFGFEPTGGDVSINVPSGLGLEPVGLGLSPRVGKLL